MTSRSVLRRAARLGRSSGATMANVLPPHDAFDEEKLDALVSAYERGREVPPVVLIRPTSPSKPYVALTGSHRVAAMLRVFGEVPDDFALVVDEADVRRRLSTPEAKKALSAYMLYQLGHDRRKKGVEAMWHHGYYDEILRTVADMGYEYEQALEGQF